MAIKDVILGYAKGEKGDPGPRGEKGNTGATGPKGDPGNIADAQITDTEGLDVAKGQKTTAQKLFDAIANRIVTKLVTNDALTKKLADYMLKGMMSNTNVNNTGTVPTSALMYSMFEQINNNLGSLLKPTTETINIDSLNLENGTYVIGTGMSGTKPFEYGILIQFKRYAYTIQIAIDIDSAAIAKRQTNNERWPNWDFYVTKSDLFTYERKFEGKDLNTIIIPGCYGCGGKPSTYGSTNYPEDITGILVVFSNTGVTVQHYYTYLGALYLRSKLLNYNEWSSWEKITK